MKLLFRLRLLCCAILLAASPFAQGQPAPDRLVPNVTRIEIKHVGPPAVSDELIRANIRLKPGEPYLRASVDDDVRNLYGTGYFNNIRVTEERSADGVAVTYVVQGKLLLTEIKFTGNTKYKRSKLLKKVTSKVGQPLDERKLFADAQEIQKTYQKVGYQKTTVEAKVNADENSGRGIATFEIEEAGKTKIKDIEFVGAEHFSEKKLRKVIKTKRRWWMSWLTGSGVLKEDEFEDDKDRLIEFFQNEGYIDVAIKDVKFDYVTPTKMVVRFFIEEGRRYKVGAITLNGNTLFSTDDIFKGINVDGRAIRPRMVVGDIFTPVGLAKDIDAIQDFYGSKGYIDARVRAVKQPNVTGGTMDLVYNLEEKSKSYIEKIDIQGNTRTKDRVIRRELTVSPGEVYDTVRVKLSKERLLGMNYFEKVEPQPEDTEIEDRKNLVIGVEEKNTGNFAIGAGINSVESVVGFVEVTQGNFDLFHPPTFTGAGQKFRLRTQIGTRRQDYQLTFIEPWFLGKKLQLGVDLFHRELSFLSDLYDETHTGGTVSLTRALGSDFLIGRVAYTLENIKLDIGETNVAPEILKEEGERLVSKVGTSITYDTRNHSLMPSRGQRSELSAEVAGGPFGADTDFYKLEFKTAWYFPGFFEGHILELVGQTGVVEEFGDSEDVPLFDKLFLGGAYNLRGFKYRKVGPKLPRNSLSPGEPLGGKTYVFGSAEYSVPIIERLRFAMFYDVGNVYAESFYLKGPEDWVDNWGIGLRINLPIGPLVLDYGIPIRADEQNDSSGRFQFRAGYNRPF